MIFSGKSKGRTSILMRTKDRPLFLRRALESVLAQDDSNWTLAIINDGGDRIALNEILAPYLSRIAGRLQLVHFDQSEGRGKGKHLNRGLEATSSEYVAIHDDDDSWEPNFLSQAKSRIGEKKALVTQSWRVMEKLENGKILELRRELYEPWQKHAISLFRLAESLTFPPIALLFRRDVIGEIGPFEDELGPLEDWEFSLRLFSRHECIFLEEPLARYHQRETCETGPSANSRLNAQEIYGRLDTEIRNSLLRKDLAQGKTGLGLLVNMAHAHGRIFLELQEQRRRQ